MVPTIVQRTVPVITCRLVSEEKVELVPTQVTCEKKECVTRCVPVSVCRQVPYTETVKVPCTKTEMVPTPVCKRVAVQVPVDVMVKQPRSVPCGQACGDLGQGACCPN